MTPDEIGQRLASLRDAGQHLKRRPVEEVLEVLGAVLDLWRDPTSRWRQELEAELPEATGFTPALIRRGLDHGLSGWTAQALRDLAIAELGPLERHDSAHRRMVSGFDVTAVILAGAIPMPTLLSLIAPLVLRSTVLAKPASRDRSTPRLLANSIAELDPPLGSCIEVVDFDADDDACLRCLLQAECVCATGSDATIAALHARLRPPQRLVADGHRVSVAAVASPSRQSSIADLAERLALDVTLWNQLGCLSPIAVFAVGDEASASEALAEALALELQRTEDAWPRGAVDAAAARDISRERSEAELRSAAGRNVVVHSSDSTAWTVVLEADLELRPAPLHRFIRVVPVSDPPTLLDALRPLGPWLAAVAIEGFGDRTKALARALAELGASRLCRPGSLQSPPLSWPHAGRGVLLPLARLSELER